MQIIFVDLIYERTLHTTTRRVVKEYTLESLLARVLVLVDAIKASDSVLASPRQVGEPQTQPLPQPTKSAPGFLAA